ncbi:MAG TPA: YciI family protein [Spirochaetota bacterium]|nr:YciI family protein [Spirochaetota bacterium]HPI89432.1 YciI family protein [Spirochaetota bacterium]HPR46900.1 YciI family protein [Spirochaetota bacterium]
MKQIFAFWYFMNFDPQKLRTAIPAHIAYWEKLAPESFSDGPFRDRSGGLVLFPADDLDTAESLCKNDPYVKEGLIEEYFVREWLISHQR